MAISGGGGGFELLGPGSRPRSGAIEEEGEQTLKTGSATGARATIGESISESYEVLAKIPDGVWGNVCGGVDCLTGVAMSG